MMMMLVTIPENAAKSVIFSLAYYLFIQFINQQWHRSTSNDTETQTKNILAEKPTQD